LMAGKVGPMAIDVAKGLRGAAASSPSVRECPRRGAPLADATDISPSGEAECQHCGAWFNVRGNWFGFWRDPLLAALEQPATGESTRPADLVATLRLTLVPGVGPRTRMALLERFGSPEAVFAASVDELTSVANVGPKLAKAISAATQEIDVEKTL